MPAPVLPSVNLSHQPSIPRRCRGANQTGTIINGQASSRLSTVSANVGPSVNADEVGQGGAGPSCLLGQKCLVFVRHHPPSPKRSYRSSVLPLPVAEFQNGVAVDAPMALMARFAPPSALHPRRWAANRRRFRTTHACHARTVVGSGARQVASITTVPTCRNNADAKCHPSRMNTPAVPPALRVKRRGH